MCMYLNQGVKQYQKTGETGQLIWDNFGKNGYECIALLISLDSSDDGSRFENLTYLETRAEGTVHAKTVICTREI